MRISDWSSDVCSSDLLDHDAALAAGVVAAERVALRKHVGDHALERGALEKEIDETWPGNFRFGQLWRCRQRRDDRLGHRARRLAERLGERSEEHTSELQSLMRISYAVFCLKKKNKNRYKRS